MSPLNDEELVLVRGMIAQHQADKARAADQRTDDNLEILALRDELALVKSEGERLRKLVQNVVAARRAKHTSLDERMVQESLLFEALTRLETHLEKTQ